MKKGIKILLTLLLTSVLFTANIKTVNAASASISVGTSKSKVVIGNTFTVTVRVSSSSALGAWEFTIDYNTNLFKLVSGKPNIADPGNGKMKSASYTYTFKAINTGSGKIGVKSYDVLAWKGNAKLSVSAGKANITVISQQELNASYSKNNNLKSMQISGYSLTPTFNKNTTEYRVELGSNVESIKVSATPEDSKSRVKGNGVIEVSEGENKIELIVTAENGSTKKYTIIANVKDLNPITVTDNLGNSLSVIKRRSLLTRPDKFIDKNITINNETVPAFYNELNNLTLVGLKDNEGNANLYIHNEAKNTFEKYAEYYLNQLKLLPLDALKEDFDNYIEEKIKLDGTEVIGYKKDKNSNQIIIRATNLETGETLYYIYDKDENTAVRYYKDIEKKIEAKADKASLYLKIIYLLCAESVIMVIIVISLIAKQKGHNKRKLEHFRNKKEEYEKKKNGK